MYNLNTHPAYEAFRLLRKLQLEVPDEDSSLQLVNGLLKYSEQGQEYIKRVKNLIQSNDLITISQQYLKQYHDTKNTLAQR